MDSLETLRWVLKKFNPSCKKKKKLKSILNRSLLRNFTKVSEDVSSAHPVYERYNSEKTVKVVHEHKPATLGFFEHLQVDMFN